MSEVSLETVGLEHAAPVRTSPSKIALWTGRVLSGLIGIALIMGGLTDVLKTQMAVDGLAQAGYPAHVIVPLGWVMIACAVIYLIPQTAVLGAILLTGYFGGAVATHVRMGDPVGMTVPAIIFAAVTWGALLLREPRLRALLPVRR